MRSEITADIANAFSTDLADAVSLFDGERHVVSNDDWAVNDNKGKTLLYDGRGVFGSYHAHEIDGQNIRANDVRLTCLQSEVTDIPAIDDVINGMRVLNIAKDPANVTWVMQLRGFGSDEME